MVNCSLIPALCRNWPHRLRCLRFDLQLLESLIPGTQHAEVSHRDMSLCPYYFVPFSAPLAITLAHHEAFQFVLPFASHLAILSCYTEPSPWVTVV